MQNTTIRLPDLYFKLIDEIILDKNYPCTSEFVRLAIRKMLKRDLLLLANSKIEDTSEKIQKLDNKQNTLKLQKNLDQFKAIFEMNPRVREKIEAKNKLTKRKQVRIDLFWK